MPLNRRRLLGAAAVLAAGGRPVFARSETEVLRTWYKLALELVRHTPTYSPPVASRAFGYLGVAAYEAVASRPGGALRTLAGQLNGLHPMPARGGESGFGEAAVLNAALARVVAALFANTGPTGQRVITSLTSRLDAEARAGLSAAAAERSAAYGRALAGHVLAWADGDGGAVIENLGFPPAYELIPGPAHWVPTNSAALQQKPLLPAWGGNRTFIAGNGAACTLPPPPAYDEAPGSPFYGEALEVLTVTKALTAEQRAIARFWSDDAMLSPTPPGHWVSIALQCLERDQAGPEKTAGVLARLGIAVADAFICCWRTKYEYDLLRPVTYIRRVLDKTWEPLLATPPFPEYPSGHSTQSAAAAEVLTAVSGGGHAFEDTTHGKDGLAPRRFASFHAAAEEAALSRLYGGIHFRAAIERGLDQGRCVGAAVKALKTWR